MPRKTTKKTASKTKQKKGRRNFGSVFRWREKDGTVRPGFYIRYRGRDGRRRTESVGPDREVAVQKLKFLAAAFAREEHLGVRTIAKLTLTEFVKVLEPVLRGRLSATSYSRTKIQLDVAAKHFGKLPMVEIDKAAIEDFFAHLATKRAKKCKPGTIRRYASSLSVVFKHGIQRGVARENPVHGIPLPKADEKPVPYLSPTAVHDLYARTPAALRPLIVLLGETGLRRGEGLGLAWSDVADDFSTLTVRTSKSHKARVVPLTERARVTLQERFKVRSPVPLDEPHLVFPEWSGRGNFVTQRFKTIAKAAGFPNLTLHGLRHAFCSSLARAGVPIPTIAELAGHATLTMTMRYAKHAPADAAARAIEALAAARDPAPQDGGTKPKESDRTSKADPESSEAPAIEEATAA